MTRLSRWTELVLPVGIITSIFVILVTLPPAIMDIFLAVNITVAVIVLLTTIYVKTPLEFNVFPSLLLATTLARLVLNIASTRLILVNGDTQKLNAAGGVIRGFGDFVAGGNEVVGIIIFIIIVAIQFLVITKGSTRISEVAARFALDGMPGQQMAIDADLNAGAIDEHEAQKRREDVTQQANFYGAMDGASKFVRGDAIAGIVITMVNIVGGLVIGIFQANMQPLEAVSVYTKLTIGDGLVSQVPALLISLAAGLLVTRSAKQSNLPAQLVTQLFSRPQALVVAGVFLVALIFTNLPTVPLLLIGGSCFGIAAMISQKGKKDEAQRIVDEENKVAEEEQAETKEERIEDYLVVDPMEMEISVDLIKLADPNRGGDLLPRITGVRQAVASEIGIVLPKVRIRDLVSLGENQYRIKIANNPVAQGFVRPNLMLAMDSGMTAGSVPGEETVDPVFQQKAFWIETGMQDRAEMMGYTPVEPAAVLATHLQEIVRQHADELLTRDATKHLLDELRETSPAVIDELIPGLLKLSEVQQVLQLLLREQVPIRQLGLILETLGDYATKTKDAIWLAEYARHRLARTICSKYRDEEGRLFVLTLDPALEDRISAGIDHNDRGLFIRMSSEAIDATCQVIAAELPKLNQYSRSQVVLVSPQIRPALRQITAANLPKLVVLSYNEITRDTKIESVGIINEAVPGNVPVHS